MRSILGVVSIIILFSACFGCGGHRQRPEPGALEASPNAIVYTARSMIGKPYRFGGLSPETGFDCSGFTWWVYHQNGIDLPRQSFDQMAQGRKISRGELLPGDLVFFDTDRKGPSHVGIYSGRNSFIHCPGKGRCVREDRLSERYWQKNYLGACRVSP